MRSAQGRGGVRVRTELGGRRIRRVGAGKNTVTLLFAIFRGRRKRTLMWQQRG